MSSILVVVCRTCRSYRLENLYTICGATRFRCASCGDKFFVYDFENYVKKHLPDKHRCPECDWEAVELVQKDYREDPDGEIADFYRCGFCGQEIVQLVRQNPGVAYD